MDETPKTSGDATVRSLYEGSADAYSEMMDCEIDLPIYADLLSRLAEGLAEIRGPVIDTSCGTGHVLLRYRERYDPERQLIGLDLSPRMVAIARARLGSDADLVVGDMRDMRDVETASAAAVMSFFALHHVDPDDVLRALKEWHRVLCPGGRFVLATWEGSGAIDYGDQSDVVALRYTEDAMVGWVGDAGLSVSRSVVARVEGMPMKAIYVEGAKGGVSSEE